MFRNDGKQEGRLLTDSPEQQDPEILPTKWDETFAFLFLALVLFPLLCIILIGGFGFVLWMSHLWFGPPGSH
jgi:periplasmic nitrate reductase NapE